MKTLKERQKQILKDVESRAALIEPTNPGGARGEVCEEEGEGGD